MFKGNANLLYVLLASVKGFCMVFLKINSKGKRQKRIPRFCPLVYTIKTLKKWGGLILLIKAGKI
jgi:hypothetical protein